MIFLNTETFDAQDTTEEQYKSSHFSKKDVRNLIIFLFVLGIVIWPVYKAMLDRRNKTVCKKYMKDIFDSMSLYMKDNDNRFPPVFAEDPVHKGPLLNQHGQAISWASVIASYVKGKTSFRCPASEDEEVAKTENPESIEGMEISYGMYAAYSGYFSELVDDPNNTAIISETSNRGARETYNPLPFMDKSGEPLPYDAFSIGWDNSNTWPNAETKAITRLAFPKTKDGLFEQDGISRHPGGIHIMLMSGQIITVNPSAALVQHSSSGQLTNLWATPPLMDP